MAFEFKPAKRQNEVLLIGLAGGTGSGKTYSAMRMASGIAGAMSKRFAVIDTEAGRARHYADQFKFDHGDLRPPFTPRAYADAIHAADDAGYPVIVVDSMSHEWAGEGGVLEMHEDELYRMAKDDYARREACKMAAWIKPKQDHKKMVQRLLQIRSVLILCFRAEEKVEMVKGSDGKMKIVPKQSLVGVNGWIPICEKNLPFELTASFLLTADAPGMPKPIKLQEQHKPMFPLNQPLDEKSGQRIAAWAAGADAPKAADPPGAKYMGEPVPGAGFVAKPDLIEKYAAASDRATFMALETSRQQQWSSLDIATKRAVKAASDAAIERIEAAEQAAVSAPAADRGTESEL